VVVNDQQTVHWLTTLARFEEELEEVRNRQQWAVSQQSLLTAALEEQLEEIAAAQAQETRINKQVRALEREIEDIQTRVDRLRQQRDQVKDNKIYQALTAEIANLGQEIDRRETEILQAIERDEVQEQEVTRQQAERDRLQVEIKERREELATIVVRAEAAQAELEREIATCHSQLPPTVASTVDRLRTSLVLPVVRLDGEACGGCHAQFPTQVSLAITKGRSVVRCQACGRYVVMLS
jgi:predicted  nucleic acid-binding Zn-ribbon protein